MLYVMLCYVMLCYVMFMLCYVMLCYVMLCYVLGGVSVISKKMLINVPSLQYMLWLEN